MTEVPIAINASGSNRPFAAPKPRLDGICDSGERRANIKDVAESDYDKPRKDIDDVAEVSWRLGKIGWLILSLLYVSFQSHNIELRYEFVNSEAQYGTLLLDFN